MSPDSTNSASNSPPPPLFIYTVTPLQVSTSTGTNNPVTLYLTVYNPKANGFVTVTDIEFAISIGTNQNDLTDDWKDVTGQSNQSEWIIEKLPYTESPLIFKVTPVQGTTGLAPNTSINFELTGIYVNDTEGGAPVFIAEVTRKQTGQKQVIINKVSPSLQINLFEVIPASIAPGEQATLSWATSGASHCTIDQLGDSTCSPPDPPTDPLPLNGQLQVCPRETTTYTLTAFDVDGGHTQATAPLSVNRVTILTFTSDPTTIDILTTPSTLKWQVENAVSLQLDPGGINVTGKTSYQVAPVTQTDYTLTASGPGGPVSQSTPVYIAAAEITSFTATPAAFYPGPPVTLAWETLHAKLSIDQGVGVVTPPAKGSIEVRPEGTTTYTLTAKGIGAPATKTATATLQPGRWVQTTIPPGYEMTYGPGLLLNYQGKLWLISLMDGFIFSSPDGNHWETITVNGPLNRRSFYSGAVFDDGQGEKMWVMGGMDNTSENSPSMNDVWSSSDGVNWTQAQTNNIWPPRCSQTCAVFQHKLWVLGGFYDCHDDNVVPDSVWSSPDGINWTQETNAPWSARGMVGATVFNPTEPAGINQLWICGGEWGGPALADAWYTTDGATWTQAQTPNWGGRMSPNLIMLDNQLWMLGGFNYNSAFLTDMWTMKADLTWTQSSVMTPAVAALPWYSNPACAFDYRLWLSGPGRIMQCYTP